MVRSILFAGALLASGAVCAQEVAISGKDFLSGAGDAKIAELARQAAASGKTLVISAPPYWQDKVAAKAHSGAANASLRMSDAFFENVMVRVEDAKPAAKVTEAPAQRPVAKAEPKPEPKVEAKPEPKQVAVVAPKPAVVEAPAPAPKPAPVEAPPVKTEVAMAPAPAPAPVVAPAPEPVAAPPAAPVVVASAAPAPVSAKPAPAPAHDPAAAAKKRLSQNLNGGQPADGTLQVAQLEKDDVLFVDGTARAVVRRFGAHTQMFWLEGDLNLERAELVVTGNGRYRVSEPIRNVTNPSLRGSAKSNSLKFAFNVPAPKSPTRVAIERQYNDGRDIAGNLQPTDLRSGDLVYTGEGSAVVVRRTGGGIERYWLVGELDLHQNGLQTQGNAIRVLTDTLK